MVDHRVVGGATVGGLVSWYVLGPWLAPHVAFLFGISQEEEKADAENCHVVSVVWAYVSSDQLWGLAGFMRGSSLDSACGGCMMGIDTGVLNGKFPVTTNAKLSRSAAAH